LRNGVIIIIQSEHSINIYGIAICYRPTYHDRVKLYKLAAGPQARGNARLARGRFVTSVLRQLCRPSTIASPCYRGRGSEPSVISESQDTINNRRTREFRCAASCMRSVLVLALVRTEKDCTNSDCMLVAAIPPGVKYILTLDHTTIDKLYHPISFVDNAENIVNSSYYAAILDFLAIVVRISRVSAVTFALGSERVIRTNRILSFR